VKYSVALILSVCLSSTALAQRLSDPNTIFRGQSPQMLVQGTPPSSALTPGYPLPAPANLQPEVVDGTSSWNAFSPPNAPIPPGGVQAMPGLNAPLNGPLLGAPNAGVYTNPYAGTPGIGGVPPVGGLQQTFQPVTPYGQFGQDPFLSQQQFSPGNTIGQPFTGAGPQGFTLPGANGPTPYRFGWQQRLRLQWLPDEDVTDTAATGNFGWFGVDYELQWTQQMPGWIFISVPQFGFRAWDGPRGLSLPNGVYHFGYELRMETPRNAGPTSFMLSVTPSVNTDFQRSPTSGAWFLDGRGAVQFQLDQYWQLVLGAQYWDRVNDRILPYGGLVYTDDFWKWELTFPEARASLFLGSEYMWAKWLYVRAEYHVEAYEVEASFGGTTRGEQIELEDWRVLLGLKMDTGYYDWFFEGGWVFGREVDFKGATPDFNIGTGFIGQLGFRF
jgi:hypothetical protein